MRSTISELGTKRAGRYVPTETICASEPLLLFIVAT